MLNSIIKFSAVAAVAAIAIIGPADARGGGGNGGGGGSGGGGSAGSGGFEAQVLARVPSSQARVPPSTVPPNDPPRRTGRPADYLGCPEHVRINHALYCTNQCASGSGPS